MHKMICLPCNIGKMTARVIYLVSSQRYEENRSFKFLISLAVETWDFLQAYCLTGDQMTGGFWLVFSSRADVSMCAELKNLTLCL